MPLDERIQRLSETIIEEVRRPIEEALRHLLTDVMAASSDDRGQALQAALSVAAAERAAALASLREELERERDAAVAALRTQLERERDEALVGRQEELAREHEAALEAVREEAASARAEQAREHDRALNEARSEAEAVGAEALRAALADTERAKQEAEARAAALEQELDQARRDAEQARADASAAEQVRRDEEQARQVAEHARYAAERAAETAEQARQDADGRQSAAEQDLRLAHIAARQQELACSDRALAAFRRLDDARSLSEVLRVLADQAEAEIGRAAILLVAGSRLRGWDWRNLPAADGAPLDVPVDPDSLFGRAIATGLPASTSDAPLGASDDALAARLAVPSGRAGLAVPIAVGGRVVAILYADDAGDRTPVVPSAWPELAEILARHAGRCLELLTISHASVLAGRAQEERAAGDRPADGSPLAEERREEESARRYARLLVSEIKLYNEAAVEQGRAERDLLVRLGPDIDRARRLYEEKIPAAVRQRVDCFDEEVVRTLAGGDASLLGQT